jgi:hypothetical protein
VETGRDASLEAGEWIGAGRRGVPLLEAYRRRTAELSAIESRFTDAFEVRAAFALAARRLELARSLGTCRHAPVAFFLG